ncbi:MAG: hypothetical protein QF785_10955 [Phycisphaeraceae bacterium]|jgi:hypothetical protein|nr:hypothetical protein [Phycisphaeraceae bacterium]MDP7347175.1 hypothetical protein [Phycisphaeraceae bacterium]
MGEVSTRVRRGPVRSNIYTVMALIAVLTLAVAVFFVGSRNIAQANPDVPLLDKLFKVEVATLDS